MEQSNQVLPPSYQRMEEYQKEITSISELMNSIRSVKSKVIQARRQLSWRLIALPVDEMAEIQDFMSSSYLVNNNPGLGGMLVGLGDIRDHAYSYGIDIEYSIIGEGFFTRDNARRIGARGCAGAIPGAMLGAAVSTPFVGCPFGGIFSLVGGIFGSCLPISHGRYRWNSHAQNLADNVNEFHGMVNGLCQTIAGRLERDVVGACYVDISGEPCDSPIPPAPSPASARSSIASIPPPPPPPPRRASF